MPKESVLLEFAPLNAYPDLIFSQIFILCLPDLDRACFWSCLSGYVDRPGRGWPVPGVAGLDQSAWLFAKDEEVCSICLPALVCYLQNS